MGGLLGRFVALPACFHLAEDLFPRVRAHAAHQWRSAGWSQTRIAAQLGVSQAMVSKYLRQLPQADALAQRLAADLVVEDASFNWCETLEPTVRRAGARAAMDDLLAAEARLLAAAPVHLVPEVGLNMARALPDAASSDDVLAYPARIVAAGDQLVRPISPAFGASRHLAGVLLAMRETNPAITAVANVRPPAGVQAARVDRTTDAADPIVAAAAGVTTLHDPGAFGIEPALYVAGTSAAHVVDQLLSLPK